MSANRQEQLTIMELLIMSSALWDRTENELEGLSPNANFATISSSSGSSKYMLGLPDLLEG